LTSIASLDQTKTSSLWQRVEAPTWLLCTAIYGGWLFLTASFHALPWWIVLPLGAWLVAWHNSLQHEIVHGHPTPWRWLNDALAYAPLGLVMAYPRYRSSHLKHHETAILTCPEDDPESFYIGKADWRKMNVVLRLLLTANNTMLGRFILGPTLAYYTFWRGARFRRGDIVGYAAHAAVLGAVIWWITSYCGIPFWAYIALFAYPGMSLTLMRSYLEHRPAKDQAKRTAIVERAPLFGLLFLNNNLHAMHHDHPAQPWFELPRIYRRERREALVQNDNFVFAGYLDVARRYLLRPKDSPAHPGFG